MAMSLISVISRGRLTVNGIVTRIPKGRIQRIPLKSKKSVVHYPLLDPSTPTVKNVQVTLFVSNGRYFSSLFSEPLLLRGLQTRLYGENFFGIEPKHDRIL
jgi:hypothetical protein